MQQLNFIEMILCQRVINVELVCWRHISSEVADKSSLPNSASDNLSLRALELSPRTAEGKGLTTFLLGFIM